MEGPGRTPEFAGLYQLPTALVGGGGVNTGFQVSSQAPTLEWWGLGEA